MSDINRDFSNLRDGLDKVHPSRFIRERVISDEIGDAVYALAKIARHHGLEPDNCDGVHHVEATIWAWLTKSDPIFGATLIGVGQYGLSPDSTLAQPRKVDPTAEAPAAQTGLRDFATTAAYGSHLARNYRIRALTRGDAIQVAQSRFAKDVGLTRTEESLVKVEFDR